MFFKIAQKVFIHLGNFERKFMTKYYLKIAQSDHTGGKQRTLLLFLFSWRDEILLMELFTTDNPPFRCPDTECL